jgi:hypothetical protein
METNLITEAAAKLIQDARVFLETEVTSLVISSETEYSAAESLIIEIKKRSKQLSGSHDLEKEPHLKAGREVDAAFFPTIRLLDEKAKILDKSGRDFREKQIAIAQEAQRKLDEENEAARRKIMDSAASKQEKAKELRAMADKLEAEGKLDEAQKCRDRAAGYDERAEAKVEQAQQRVAPIVQAAVPPAKRGGFNNRTTYKAKIVKMPALMGYLSAAVPPAVEAVIRQWADAQARASQGAPSTIPGVEFLKI